MGRYNISDRYTNLKTNMGKKALVFIILLKLLIATTSQTPTSSSFLEQPATSSNFKASCECHGSQCAITVYNDRDQERV